MTPNIACHRCEEFSPRIQEIRTSGCGESNLYKCGNCGTILGKGTESEVLDDMEEVANRLKMQDEHITLDNYE